MATRRPTPPKRPRARPAAAPAADAAGSAERLRQLVARVPAIIWATDRKLRFTSSLGAGLAALSLQPDQVVGMPVQEFLGVADDADPTLAAHRAALSGATTSLHVEFGGRRYDVTVEPLHDDTGRIIGTFGCAFDVTERGRAEAALREREELLRAIIAENPVCVKLLDRAGRLLQMNPAGLAMIDAAYEEDVRGRALLDLVDAEERDQFAALTRGVFEGMSGRLEFGVTTLKGRHRRFETTAVPLRNAAGEIHACLGITRDVTERARLEEELRQAHKMEAVGLLAGGVAHDFNNIITAVIGHATLLLEDLPDGDPRRTDVLEIRRAADRAAALTRQLLAFSRKQMFRLATVDVNAVVSAMESLLTRVIGEDVTLTTVLGAGAWPVRADASQLEQVIMNLAVNARDAMPRGGRLTLETANVTFAPDRPRREESIEPGDYVLIAVSDTGAGMDAETRRRIFEPFFTTKGPGRGTGLGLATVYGIVNQLGGTIWVYSEVGVGTTFKIYLPRAAGAGARRDSGGAAAQAPGGRETVLLVEDDAAVRTVARRSLEALGYRVVDMDNPAAALAHGSKPGEPVDILVTDVVMPEMSGRELGARLRERRPELKVLYMSGYTDDARMRHGVLEEGLPYLEKPFTPDTLARRVREVLDA